MDKAQVGLDLDLLQPARQLLAEAHMVAAVSSQTQNTRDKQTFGNTSHHFSSLTRLHEIQNSPVLVGQRCTNTHLSNFT